MKKKLLALGLLAIFLIGCTNEPVKHEDKNPEEVYENSNRKYKELDDYSLTYSIGIEREGDLLTSVLMGLVGEIELEIAEKNNKTKVRFGLLSSNGTSYVENKKAITCFDMGFMGLNGSSCKRGEDKKNEDNTEIIEPEEISEAINYTFEYKGEKEHIGRKCDYIVMTMKPEAMKESKYENASKVTKEVCYDREHGFPHYIKIRAENVKDEEGKYTISVFGQVKEFRKGIKEKEVEIPVDSTVEEVDCGNKQVKASIVPFSEEVTAKLKVRKDNEKVLEKQKTFSGLVPWEENAVSFDAEVSSGDKAVVCVGKVCEEDFCSAFSIYE